MARHVGGAVFVPRDMLHCFKNCSDSRARVLTLFTPGDIEGFFDYGRPLADGSTPSDEVLMERITRWARNMELNSLDRRPYLDRPRYDRDRERPSCHEPGCYSFATEPPVAKTNVASGTEKQ